MTGVSRTVAWGLVAVAGVAGAAAAQPPAGGGSVKLVSAAEAAPQPGDPLGGMLAEAKTAYAKARDYVCTFTRQERVNGVLGAEQVGELKVRAKPYSVAVRFARPTAVYGMEMSYVAGSRLEKVTFRPAGAKGLDGALLVTLDDPKVMAENRHPVTELGIGAVLDRLSVVASREHILGNAVEAFTSDYTFAGRSVTRYEVYTRRPHAHRYAYKYLVFVDKETKLPARFEAYDAPKAGGTAADLLESYSFTDVKVNVGLGDSAFSR
jgi:hypothetical protein